MIELRGKYNTCKVFTDIIDNETIGQLTNLLNQESIKNCQIRIMSDCHAGKGCVIGTTITIKDKIIPNLVGVDIGCGILAIKLKEKRIDLPAFDSIVRKYVPSGANIHQNSNEEYTSINIKNLKCFGKSGSNIKEELIYKSIGTLGGGNHFIEIDKGEDNALWLVIHTGSRNLGNVVCEYYQNAGYKSIQELVKNGIKQEKVPFELAYVENELFQDYIHDMQIVQQYAKDNREEIARTIIKHAKLHKIDEFDTIHNYIDTNNMILRKGAISAQKDEKVLIPMNMRDGSLICIGKGNPDWNFSAPHGAGRTMSRGKAKESISMSDYKKSMKGIYTTCVNSSTIDESAFAYKPMESIISNIQETVDIVEIIKPIYNFKASD